MENIVFKDINFKFTVINELIMLGYFENEVGDILSKHGDDEHEPFLPITSIYNFFKNLPLTKEHLEKVTQICPDGGDEIYMYMVPDWDGEDDQFDIMSIEDVKLLPNLQSVDIYCLIGEKSIDLTPLKSCSKLQKVNMDKYYIKDNKTNQEIINEFQNKGIM